MFPLVPSFEADGEHACQQLKVWLDFDSETVPLTRFEEGGARTTYPVAAFNQMIASLRQVEAALTEYSERVEEIVEEHGRLRRQEKLAVLGNLVTNAYQAMPEGGRLTFSAGAEQEIAILSVVDTGRGIPLENMDKLFEPLFTTRARASGWGWRFRGIWRKPMGGVSNRRVKGCPGRGAP